MIYRVIKDPKKNGRYVYPGIGQLKVWGSSVAIEMFALEQKRTKVSQKTLQEFKKALIVLSEKENSNMVRLYNSAETNFPFSDFLYLLLVELGQHLKISNLHLYGPQQGNNSRCLVRYLDPSSLRLIYSHKQLNCTVIKVRDEETGSGKDITSHLFGFIPYITKDHMLNIEYSEGGELERVALGIYQSIHSFEIKFHKDYLDRVEFVKIMRRMQALGVNLTPITMYISASRLFQSPFKLPSVIQKVILKYGEEVMYERGYIANILHQERDVIQGLPVDCNMSFFFIRFVITQQLRCDMYKQNNKVAHAALSRHESDKAQTLLEYMQHIPGQAVYFSPGDPPRRHRSLTRPPYPPPPRLPWL